ncbi:unnamed protein product [Cladocopium goreaui]|uniref:SET domain-containing protein n=1 Tax=Cladocopium goreaui TaxID=2562237 RepID=A0A9P1D511_9DINO|nr:unnamed protein product [Cladocopium goreaui]
MRADMEKAADSERTLKLLEVFAVNSVATPRGGSGLYLRCSRANHSCRPNGFFRVSKDGHLALVARRAISAGEEVTISYLPESELLQPLARRQRSLTRFGFQCRCERCCADDLRSFRCTCQALVEYRDGGWQCDCGLRYSEEEIQQVEDWV